MKIFTSLLFALFYSALLYGRLASDTIYLDDTGKKVKASGFTFYRIVTSHKDSFIVEEHYKNGEMRMKGAFTSLEPTEVKNGSFTYYRRNGSKAKECTYANNLIEGDLLKYDSLGRLRERVHYKHDKWGGSRITYYASGTKHRDEIYSDGVFLSGHFYNKEGQETEPLIADGDLGFPGGEEALGEFIRLHTSYPKAAEEKAIDGRVTVAFIVELDGSISNIEVIESNHKKLNKMAANIVRQMPKLIPFKKDGQPARCTYHLPLRFKFSPE